MEAPAYTLRTSKITGKVVDGNAELDADLALTITGKGNQWVRIPLRFTNSVLREPPTHEGKGDVFFAFEPEGDGYVCWLRAAEKTDHVLKCRFLAKVQELGAESRLSLTAPLATSGKLELQIPEADARATPHSPHGRTSVDVSSSGTGSKIEMLGPAGEFIIAWRGGRDFAETAADHRIGRHAGPQTGKQAPLDLRRAAESPQFRRTARNVQRPTPAGHAAALARSARHAVDRPRAGDRRGHAKANSGRGSADRCKVERAGGHCRWSQNTCRESAAGEQPIEIGGFEIVDAVKHTARSTWWSKGINPRSGSKARTSIGAKTPAKTRPAKVAGDGSITTCNHFLCKCKLCRATRIAVEPLYIVYVENGQLRLDATLKYKVRGTAKAYNLEHEFSRLDDRSRGSGNARPK